jgi:hypothetical protein
MPHALFYANHHQPDAISRETRRFRGAQGIAPMSPTPTFFPSHLVCPDRTSAVYPTRQHSCDPPGPLSSDLVVAEIEVNQRWALR